MLEPVWRCGLEKILILGAGGMLGYAAYRYLSDLGYNITGVTKTRKRDGLICLDATVEPDLAKLLQDIQPHIIINCAALLAGPSEERKSEAVRLNAWLPHYLEEYCESHNAYLIQVSTDGVFSGGTGGYEENAPSDTNLFYGKSKYLGEVHSVNALTVRSAFWGMDVNPQGKGLFQWFMRQQGTVGGYASAFFNGVSNLEFAKFAEKAMEGRFTGIYHLCAKDVLSKYEFLCLQKQVFQRNVEIKRQEQVCIDRSLTCTRQDIPYEQKSFEEMMLELKEWQPHLYNR